MYNDKSFCVNEQCAEGVPYLVGIVCAQEAAKYISKTDKNIAKQICDKWAEIDKQQFKDSIIMATMPSTNLVNCYLKTGNEKYQAEAMCVNTDEGYMRDSCIKMAQSQLEIRKNSI